jgi:4-amino-4-deoxy-L-arabinose transferase-like glycosyltransferase
MLLPDVNLVRPRSTDRFNPLLLRVSLRIRFIVMESFGDWIFVAPLVPAVLLLLYYVWQAFKEIKPMLQQVKSLQKEILKTKNNVNTLLTDMQSTGVRIAEERQIVQELIMESRATYDKVKETGRAVVSLNAFPVRQGIYYLKERWEDRRSPKKVDYFKSKAAEIKTRLQRSEFSEFPPLIGLMLGATALIFALRKRSRPPF